MTDYHSLELSPIQLYRRCSPENFAFTTTADIDSEPTIYGQERGTTAIEFGIDIHDAGYNIYVLGPSGSGRLTAVEHFINDRARLAAAPDDWCYVYNFQQPQEPIALQLPAGQGRRLQTDMDKLIGTLKVEIPQVFESEVYLKAQTEIKDRFATASEAILNRVQKLAAEQSFSLQAAPQGALVIIPMIDGKPVLPEVFSSLPAEIQARFTAGRRELEEAIEGAFRESRALQKEAEQALDTLRRDIARQVIEAHMGDVIRKYDTRGAVIEYLSSMRDDILDGLDHFETDNPPSQENDDNTGFPPGRSLPDHYFKRYAVNVFVENDPNDGAPVIMLDLPTYQNLVGRIEHEVKFGMYSTDFTQIKSGALHRANGGFLILRAKDLLQQPLAWDALKRTLISGQVIIEDVQARGMSVIATQQLEPAPIPVDIKVVLVGAPLLYYMLYEVEEDFGDLFRVKADFVDTMNRNEQNQSHYAAFIANLCRHEQLLHFDAGAVARIVDYGSWLVGDQYKLAATFGQITPLIYESVFFARRNRHQVVTAADVEQALAARVYRSNETEQLRHEQISEGTIFIDLTGTVVGQINALVVVTSGEYTFGLPSRLTARVYMGRKDVIQIDREIAMTGPIHDKGVLILQGYLGGRYAQDYPLALTASLTFEQSYAGIEGDSASSAELFALLSALSGFPIRQDLAVTGSVNQRGQVQPIGGVTQKIEGFFKVCQAQGLTGTQGVIIPRSNVRHLMLNEVVVKAVETGQFHIYAIETVDEGIMLLTGKDPQLIHEAVAARLRQFAELLARFER